MPPLTEQRTGCGNLPHLVSAAIRLPRDVIGEHLKDALFIHQLFSPHLQQVIFGGLALQVEEVIVIQFTKGRRGRVAPERDKYCILKKS